MYLYLYINKDITTLLYHTISITHITNETS